MNVQLYRFIFCLCYHCVLLLHKSARVEGRPLKGQFEQQEKNCVLRPSHTLNKSLPGIVTSKSLTLPDSIHLDHNLSTPIGSNRRFCLRKTQFTTFKNSFIPPAKNKELTALSSCAYYDYLPSNTLD